MVLRYIVTFLIILLAPMIFIIGIEVISVLISPFLPIYQLILIFNSNQAQKYMYKIKCTYCAFFMLTFIVFYPLFMAINCIILIIATAASAIALILYYLLLIFLAYRLIYMHC